MWCSTSRAWTGVYLNAYVPILQSSGQVVAFMTQHLGMQIPSPAAPSSPAPRPCGPASTRRGSQAAHPAHSNAARTPAGLNPGRHADHGDQVMERVAPRYAELG